MKEVLVILLLLFPQQTHGATLVVETNTGRLVIIEDVKSVVISDDNATTLNVQPLDDGEEGFYPVPGCGKWAIETR